MPVIAMPRSAVVGQWITDDHQSPADDGAYTQRYV
jgi:hypothetical protein